MSYYQPSLFDVDSEPPATPAEAIRRCTICDDYGELYDAELNMPYRCEHDILANRMKLSALYRQRAYEESLDPYEQVRRIQARGWRREAQRRRQLRSDAAKRGWRTRRSRTA